MTTTKLLTQMREVFQTKQEVSRRRLWTLHKDLYRVTSGLRGKSLVIKKYTHVFFFQLLHGLSMSLSSSHATAIHFFSVKLSQRLEGMAFCGTLQSLLSTEVFLGLRWVLQGERERERIYTWRFMIRDWFVHNGGWDISRSAVSMPEIQESWSKPLSESQSKGRGRPMSQLEDSLTENPYSASLFYSGLQRIGWDPPALGRAIRFSLLPIQMLTSPGTLSQT